MKTRITYVVEYDSVEATPRVFAHMKIAGGDLVGVQFSDALSELQKLQEAVKPDPVKGRF